MKRFLFALLFLLSPPAGANELVELATADQARNFTAVGRLELNGKGFCTASLVSFDLVLTAAHCLYNTDTLERLPTDELTFLAGLRNGRSEAIRQVRRVAIDPDYDPGSPTDPERIGNDLALIELSQPIRNSRIVPFLIEDGSRTYDQVSMVSYALHREKAPSLERSCDVLDRYKNIHVLSCDIDFGASGAPVVVFENGRPRIVAVVSAMARDREGGKIALAADAARIIPQLRRNLREGVVTERAEQPLIRSADPKTRMQGAGAKFVRP